MDEFGVLTERFGLKPQGKAAPMAAPKGPSSYVNNVQSRSSGHNHVSAPTNRSSSHSSSPSPWNANSGNDGASSDSYSDFLQSKSDNKGQSFGDLDAYGDFLRASNKSSRSSASNSGAAASFDYDSFFGSKPTSNYDNDDIFGGMPGNSLGRNDDVFATFASPPGQSSPVDDLLGGFGNGDDIFGNAGMNVGKSHGNGSAAGSTAAGFDELIPGFGGSSPPKNDSHKKKPPKSHVYSAELNSMSEDPFVLLESTSKGKFSDPLEESNQFGNFQQANDTADKVKNPSVSAIDELEKFAMGKMRRNASTESDFLSGGKRVMAPGKDSRHKEGSGAAHRNSADDLESFFSVSSRSSSVPKSRPPSSMKNKEVSKTSPARADQKGMKKASSTTNMIDDLSFMFGASSFAGEFEEIEGESEERRRARLGRHGRTQERVAKAVAEMNQRDFQTQQEQEERQRIAENLDVQIRSWAAGKEGNLRALLSSLQHVLWPECGWEPVSLTDLITSTSVKKVYRKATLCVHPDKVQQKGASLQNKYTAEKVFDILKEAWKKFDAEELR